ncbi:MAG: hypothetical protein C0407_04080 [Desulfobacca sp.]|nr:hypothetical protein [Desulfobacca sp.]
MWAIVRDMICKKCGFKGIAEDEGLNEIPRNKIFKHLGKTAKGHLHFRCPSCKTVAAYSPYSFIHPVIKIIAGALIAVIILGIIKSLSK